MYSCVFFSLPRPRSRGADTSPAPLHRLDIRRAPESTALLPVGVAPFAGCAVGGPPAAHGTGEGVQAWSRRKPAGAPRATAAGAGAALHNTPGDRCHDCGTVGDASRRLPAAPRREPGRSWDRGVTEPSRTAAKPRRALAAPKSLCLTTAFTPVQPSSDGLAPWVVPSAPLPQGDSLWLAPSAHVCGRLLGREAGRYLLHGGTIAHLFSFCK